MPVNLRNVSVWKPLTSLEYMGISNPLLANEVVLDTLGKGVIGNNITIVDDKIRIKEEQRDALIKLGYDTITNEMTLTDMDAVTRRAVMALQISANDYMHLVELYVVKVLNLIADAKEYAFEVGKNAVDLAQVKAEIAEEKGAIYIQKVNLQIQLEVIERQHVEIELMRAKLAAVKAQTNLLMAELDVKKAELRLIEVAVETAMAEVTKVQIEVDIAMVIADIVTRGLAAVKYSVEVAEIAAAFTVIATRLAATLSVITEKESQLGIQSDSKKTILGDILVLNSANIEAQGLRVDEVNSDQDVQEYEASKTAEMLSQEGTQIANLTAEIINEIVTKINAIAATETGRTLASAILDAAYIVAKDKTRRLTSNTQLGQRVHPNSSIVC